MVRTIISAVVGAIIVFVWGFIAWPILDLWGDEVRDMPGDGAMEAYITEQIPEDGAYYYPGMPDDLESEEMDAWTERHKAGPVGMLMIQKSGTDPMAPASMLGGLLISFLAAVLISGVLAYAGSLGSSYGGRVVIGIVFALFAVASTFVMQWNWFFWPGDYVKALSLDLLIGWILAVVVMAGIVGGARSEPIMTAD